MSVSAAHLLDRCHEMLSLGFRNRRYRRRDKSPSNGLSRRQNGTAGALSGAAAEVVSSLRSAMPLGHRDGAFGPEDIEMSESRRLRRHFLALFLPLAGLVAVAGALVGQARVDAEFGRMVADDVTRVRFAAAELAGDLKVPLRHLLSLPKETPIRAGIGEPTSERLADLAAAFASLLLRNPGYDQVRWIDQTGKERVRVNAGKDGAGPVVVPERDLQDKTGRTYVTETMPLKIGDVYVSPLDLNVENGKVEIPYKPMLRVATPVADDAGSRRGILVINVLGAPILKDFSLIAESVNPGIMLLNQQGYWLHGADAAEPWGLMLGRSETTLGRRHPAAWAEIASAESGHFFDDDGLWVWEAITAATVRAGGLGQTGEPYWLALSHRPAAAVRAVSRAVWVPTAGISIFLLAILAAMSWYAAARSKIGRDALLARIRAEAAAEENRRQRDRLEEQVAERTAQIQQAEAKLRETNRELETALAEARAATAAKSQFFANMSHEIRTPMNAVLGFLGLALNDALSDATRGHLTIALDAAQSLLRLIDDILDLSKLQTGKVDLEEIVFDLPGTVRETLDMLRLKAGEKQLDFQFRYPSDLPDCHVGDPLRMRQLVANLVGNAIKFTETGAVTVSVAAAGEAGLIKLAVSDTGIGMTSDQASRLFEPFVQADSSMTRRFGGSGLGLSICREIAEAMGGRIWVESEPGAGSIFHVLLRLAPAPCAVACPEHGFIHQRPAQPPRRSNILLADNDLETIEPADIRLTAAGLRVTAADDRKTAAEPVWPLGRGSAGRDKIWKVLVVDDQPTNLEVLGGILHKSYDLAFATSGEQALEAARRQHPDLILLDVMMPDMDGYEVCRRLKADPALEHIPVILVTARDEREGGAKGFDAGAVDYITKPVLAPLVRARVRTHIAMVDQFTLLDRLGVAGEFKDNETGAHVRRIGRYAEILARRLGWSDGACMAIAKTAPLHDVGKIAIPDRILLKPGRLDEEEWVVMRSHTERGAAIIGANGSALMQMAARIALSHHEKWDGSGYPRGLAGEDIPIEGRIVAIADVYDALMSARPYKEPWTQDAVVPYLREQAGRHFDPDLLPLFLASTDDFAHARLAFPD
ncbi:MAG: response regulator [Azospirillum sp.]|nr:response regulator [Azospirillum sp.]